VEVPVIKVVKPEVPADLWKCLDGPDATDITTDVQLAHWAQGWREARNDCANKLGAVKAIVEK
jgi:hypothetical protein